MVNFVKLCPLMPKSAHGLETHPSVVLLSPLSLPSMHAMGVPAYHSSVRVAEIIKILPIAAGSCGPSGAAGGDVPFGRAAGGAGCLGAGLSHPETGSAAVVPQSIVQGRLCRRPGLVRAGLSG
jgi:hypothetical protein